MLILHRKKKEDAMDYWADEIGDAILIEMIITLSSACG
jgi:hypothetical protein